MSGRIDDGGPAFPRTGTDGTIQPQSGMTLRDWFAGQSLTSIGNEYVAHGEITEGARLHAATLAAHAYNIADAMIAAREGGDQ
jgi:hypothetical protein